MGLFEPQAARKPNKYPWTDGYIEAIHNGFWTHSEFSFKSDYGQFRSDLNEQEQGVIIRALSAIGQIEVAVKTFWADLGKTLAHPSIIDLGLVMAGNEVVHNRAYEHLITVLGMEDIFEENLKNPVVAGRVEYLKKYLNRAYTDDRKQFIYSIILFTLFVENVSLFSQFYVIMHFNRFKNVLKDTSQQVEYTRNEETLHANVGITLINTLRQEYPELFDAELEARIWEECQVAFNAESRVIDWILEDYTADKLSPGLLKAYIGERLNTSMRAIGFTDAVPMDRQRLEEYRKDFNWMDEETIGNNATDFFHKRPVDYAKSDKSYDVGDLF